MALPQTISRTTTRSYQPKYDTSLQTQNLLPIAQNMTSQIFGNIKPPPGYGDSLTAIRQAQNRASQVLTLLHYLMNQDRWAYEYNQRLNQMKQNNPPTGFHILNPEILTRRLFGGISQNSDSTATPQNTRQRSTDNNKADNNNTRDEKKKPEDNTETKAFRGYLLDPSTEFTEHKHNYKKNRIKKFAYEPAAFYLP
jgi:hypothetical protein